MIDADQTFAKNAKGKALLRAEKKGVYKGRKPSIDPEAVKELVDEGKTPTEISRALGISRPEIKTSKLIIKLLRTPPEKYLVLSDQLEDNQLRRKI